MIQARVNETDEEIKSHCRRDYHSYNPMAEIWILNESQKIYPATKIFMKILN